MRNDLSKIFTSDIANLDDTEFNDLLAKYVPDIPKNKLNALIVDIASFNKEELSEKIDRLLAFVMKKEDMTLTEHDANIVLDYCMTKKKLDILLVGTVISAMVQVYQVKTLHDMCVQTPEGHDGEE